VSLQSMPAGHIDAPRISKAARPPEGEQFQNNRHWFAKTFCMRKALKLVGGNAMKLPRRAFLYLSASAAARSGLPGGWADIVARIMAGWLPQRLGQQVIVENKSGAATNIATEAVIASPPDG